MHRQILGLIVALALAGCGSPARRAEPGEALVAPPPVDAAQAARLCRIEAGASEVRIHVFRGGAAARLGHDHVLTMPALQGWVALPASPAQGVGGASFALGFRLDELVVDPPALRRNGLDEEAVAGTRANMLGDAVLQAARFPAVRIRSLATAGEGPRLAVQAEFELHGQKQAQWLPLTVRVERDGLAATGSLVLRQTDFGIKPYAILGGLLAVRDELVIDFDLRCRFSAT